MDVEAILRVADAIEKHEIEGLGFNMAVWYGEAGDFLDTSQHNCGTIACIGGWTGAVFKNDATIDSHEAADILGLTISDRFDLFFGTPHGKKPEDVTPAEAIRTLRNLAAAGVVDWNLPETAAT